MEGVFSAASFCPSAMAPNKLTAVGREAAMWSQMSSTLFGKGVVVDRRLCAPEGDDAAVTPMAGATNFQLTNRVGNRAVIPAIEKLDGPLSRF